ncbi:hypothetical protein AAFF_G00195100 [Aldrovandia affinis]|uniref:Uncharacterized protein n=1 Tax=Aldrovandia affinis TaxID=143900 RepID=A0AAD7WV29_9TELE|nr:hypothetical protein AAFF_G00195100 [Aldrovandia affinis]
MFTQEKEQARQFGELEEVLSVLESQEQHDAKARLSAHELRFCQLVDFLPLPLQLNERITPVFDWVETSSDPTSSTLRLLLLSHHWLEKNYSWPDPDPDLPPYQTQERLRFLVRRNIEEKLGPPSCPKLNPLLAKSTYPALSPSPSPLGSGWLTPYQWLWQTLFF